MYDTLINGIKGNVDSKQLVNNEVVVKGWSFSESQGVCPVRSKYDGSVKSVDIETRPDITAKFNKNNIILCGWKLTVPVNKFIDLQVKIGNDWSTFMSINTFNVASDIPKVEPTATNQVIIPAETKTTDPLKEQIRDSLSKKPDSIINFSRNINHLSNLYIVDNFYSSPEDVRNTGISSATNNELNNIIKNIPVIKAHFEKIMGIKLDSFNKYSENGSFKYSKAGDPIEFGTKQSQYAGIVFLTPNAPINTGLTLYKSRYVNKTIIDESDRGIVFKNGNLDSTEFEPIDVIGNVYNRLVIFNAKQIHAISAQFGKDIKSGRLVQIFAFDIDSEELNALKKMEENGPRGILKNDTSTKKISFNM